jgi:hypothetical protein
MNQHPLGILCWWKPENITILELKARDILSWADITFTIAQNEQEESKKHEKAQKHPETILFRNNTVILTKQIMKYFDTLNVGQTLQFSIGKAFSYWT